ncbi:HAD family hydrolase [Pseudooceanicola sp. LIPI14-2-Ac024]|uniref:sulfotransferase-like domain-containing protein n=1 Tax=Pseudooceanicola sp. LIPI14-2-Ac024 TaxID=3344875 RepID=UPI0035D0AB67
MKIACWSGPRNLSTAMMYAFENRADFTALDEPFYAAYLARTGKRHPMDDVILTAQPQDPDTVIDALTGPIPGGARHVWHKHMAQHMLPGIRRQWIGGMTNVFLIRHPARVVASFSARFENPELEDIGFVQQAELHDLAAAEGDSPVVIDATDIRANPEGLLRALCEAIGLDWDPAVLSWPAGARAIDGVWAPHWYDAVHRSTGFAGAEGGLPHLDGRAEALADAAMPYYEHLHARRLKI